MIYLSVENNRTNILGMDEPMLAYLDQILRYPTPQAVQAEGIELPGDVGGWDGWVRMLNRPVTIPAWFPTGLLSMVTEALDKSGRPYQVSDTREKPSLDIPEPGVKIPLRDYQSEAVREAIKRGRGVLDMPPRCHALGEQVLLATGERICVEDVRVGDALLGPDGTPREVLEVHGGEDLLYRVTPLKWAKPFVVNQEHLLVFKRNVRLWRRFAWREELLAVKDYAVRTPNWRRRTYLQFAPILEFQGEADLPLDPYLLGLLLGDGYLAKTPELTAIEPAVQQAAILRGQALGLQACRVIHPPDRAPKVVFSNGSAGTRAIPNPLVVILKRLGLWGKKSGDKFIPDQYLRGSVSARRALLAGLVDTDGHLANGTYFEYVTKSDRLAQDVAFLAGSLGLRVSHRPKDVGGSTFNRLNLCGDTSQIPSQIPRKRSEHPGRDQDRGVSFTVEPVGRGDFVGFTVSGDHRYVDAQFIVHHNSGKTRTMCAIHHRLAIPTIWIAPTDRIVRQTYETLEGFFGRNYAFHLVGSADVVQAKGRRVVVCTAATALMLPEEFYRSRECVVVDEWHHAAAPSYKRVFKHLDHCYYRFGMTGTFFRSGQDAMAMHAILSDTIYKVTSQQLLDWGYLVPVHAVFVPVPTKRLYGVENNFITGHGKHGIHENRDRNQVVAHTAMMLRQTGRNVLVLVGTKKQGYMLQKILNSLLPRPPKSAEFKTAEFVSTDMPRSVQGRVLKSFEEGQEVKVLLGTSILGEGVDLPTADALVLARGEKAEVTLVQSMYRVCTAQPGKANAIVVDFSDRHHRKLQEHSLERLRVYYGEPTFHVQVLDDPRQFPGWLKSTVPNRGARAS